MNVAQVAGRIREQIRDFSGILSRGLGKVEKRFVQEMLYGIQTRQSVRLSQIGRSLREKTALKKVVERLSRRLGRPGLGERIARAVIAEGARRIHADTLLIVDPSDITKPYAEKMEHLAEVRDGDKASIGNGYWTIHIVGAECGEPEITPLSISLWSQEAEGFVSENQEILQAIDRVREQTRDKGIWVIDRAGDRRKLLVPFLEREMRFVCRMVGNRHVIYRGRARLLSDVARGCPLPYADRIVKEDKGKEVSHHLEYGFRRVKLPGRDEGLYLIVITGLGSEPTLLLTNVAVRKSRRLVWWFVEAYLTRWRVEDTIRFIKQSYDLEDIRVLKYARLQNMMAFVVAAAYFAAVYLGTGTKLRILAHHVLRAAQRLFGIPDFRYYALADGLAEILNRSNRGPGRGGPRRVHEGQLLLFES